MGKRTSPSHLHEIKHLSYDLRSLTFPEWKNHLSFSEAFLVWTCSDLRLLTLGSSPVPNGLGGWITNPSEKIWSQNGLIFPKCSAENETMFETTGHQLVKFGLKFSQTRSNLKVRFSFWRNRYGLKYTQGSWNSHPKQGTVQGKATRMTPDINMSEPPDWSLNKNSLTWKSNWKHFSFPKDSCMTYWPTFGWLFMVHLGKHKRDRSYSLA